MVQEFEKYTAADREVWKILFDRQVNNLQEKGALIYLESLERMRNALHGENLPHFRHIDNWFETSTGWSIEVVPGLIPVSDFFHCLSNKKFCSSTWIRDMAHLDYLEEPDMFHDTFGHIPLLSDPTFSAFMHRFGEIGVRHSQNKEVELQLQRLYWFTIEFGVIREDKIRSYGAGIMSSFGETNHVAESEVRFEPFSLEKIIHTPFRTDVIQETYFVLESFDQLFEALEEMERGLED